MLSNSREEREALNSSRSCGFYTVGARSQSARLCAPEIAENRDFLRDCDCAQRCMGVLSQPKRRRRLRNEPSCVCHELRISFKTMERRLSRFWKAPL